MLHLVKKMLSCSFKEKPHKCEVCNKTFPTPGDLKSHRFVHSGVWPFRCHICNRGFTKQNIARNHMLGHIAGRITVPVKSNFHMETENE